MNYITFFVKSQLITKIRIAYKYTQGFRKEGFFYFVYLKKKENTERKKNGDYR